ncbi:MAG: hypothetical protein AB7Q17_11405 [Phycisphaerae bacterium]
MLRTRISAVGCLVAALWFAGPAVAQEDPAPGLAGAALDALHDRYDEHGRRINPIADLAGALRATIVTPNTLGGGYTNNIVITGYWPPTNEMLRAWSSNATQNPGGWVGENWEGRGYNVYAFFPEFPGGLGRGTGDFEVDYQDTSADWWSIVPALRPVAIITFSRANTTNGWELEGGNRTYATGQWNNDYLAPLQPTSDLPIIQLEPPLTVRNSTLPMQAIVDAVAAQVVGVNPFTTVVDDGRFLSNFIGYHGCWYHTMHADPQDASWNVASGHIHVGMNTNINAAIQATEVTLRVLIDHVDAAIAALPVPGDLNCDGLVNNFDIDPFVLALTDPASYAAAFPTCDISRADVNDDGLVNNFDIDPFVALLTE